MRVFVILACLAVAVSANYGKNQSEKELHVIPEGGLSERPGGITGLQQGQGPQSLRHVACLMGKSGRLGISPLDIDLSDIDNRQCTDVILSSIIPDARGSVSFLDIEENRVFLLLDNLKALRNRNVRVLLSLTGWERNTELMNSLISTRESRGVLINNIVDLLKTNRLDGLDLDLAYNRPLNLNMDNQLNLVQELRSSFFSNRLLMSMTVNANQDFVNYCYRIPELARNVDWINLRTIDMNAQASRASLLAPLQAPSTNEFSVESSVRSWLNQGVDASKLLLSIPLTARLYTLANPANNLPGAEVLGEPEILPYNRACGLLQESGWDVRFDEAYKAQYAVRGNQWLTLASQRSISEKAGLVRRLGLGGIAAWGIESDDLLGSCGMRRPLLSIISSFLWRGDLSNAEGLMEIPHDGGLMGGIGPCNSIGFAPDNYDFTRFFRCVINGNKIELHPMKCPSGLVFHPAQSLCDWPRNI